MPNHWYDHTDGSYTTGGTTLETVATIAQPGHYRLEIDDAAVVGGTSPDIYESHLFANARNGGTERLVEGFPVSRVGAVKISGIWTCEFDVGDTATLKFKRVQGSDRAIPYRIQRAGGRAGTVQSDAGNSATQFKSDFTETATDYWKRALVRMLNGSLKDQVAEVSAYDGTNKIVTVTGGFTGTPANGDDFELIG